MDSVADDIGSEVTAPRPPARNPASAPARAANPGADADLFAETATQTQPRPQPHAVAPVQPQRMPTLAHAPAPVTTERRYRQTIHRVDLWSVLKISVCFYICGMAVTMVALVALWVIADAAGVIHSVEKFLGDLLQTKNFTFLDGAILKGALLISAVIVVLQIVITVIGAAFYNVFAELFGGIEITISEDETSL
jgi:hypothetical protein